MVPGPLPAQTDEPRPTAWIALRSQPVALIEGQAGRRLPVCVWLGWVGTGMETGPHAPIRIAVSTTRPDRATLDMVVYAATDPAVGSFASGFQSGNARPRGFIRLGTLAKLPSRVRIPPPPPSAQGRFRRSFRTRSRRCWIGSVFRASSSAPAFLVSSAVTRWPV